MLLTTSAYKHVLVICFVIRLCSSQNLGSVAQSRYITYIEVCNLHRNLQNVKKLSIKLKIANFCYDKSVNLGHLLLLIQLI